MKISPMAKKALSRHWWVIALLTVLSGLAGWLVGVFFPAGSNSGAMIENIFCFAFGGFALGFVVLGLIYQPKDVDSAELGLREDNTDAGGMSLTLQVFLFCAVTFGVAILILAINVMINYSRTRRV